MDGWMDGWMAGPDVEQDLAGASLVLFLVFWRCWYFASYVLLVRTRLGPGRRGRGRYGDGGGQGCGKEARMRGCGRVVTWVSATGNGGELDMLGFLTALLALLLRLSPACVCVCACVRLGV